jgi:hypothetical protein
MVQFRIPLIVCMFSQYYLCITYYWIVVLTIAVEWFMYNLCTGCNTGPFSCWRPIKLKLTADAISETVCKHDVCHLLRTAWALPFISSKFDPLHGEAIPKNIYNKIAQWAITHAIGWNKELAAPPYGIHGTLAFTREISRWPIFTNWNFQLELGIFKNKN